MNINNLINELESIKAEHGDSIEVVLSSIAPGTDDLFEVECQGVDLLRNKRQGYTNGSNGTRLMIW